MEEFKKWQQKREIKTLGYLDIHTAFKAGEKNGWRTALEWALDRAIYAKTFGHLEQEIRDELEN